MTFFDRYLRKVRFKVASKHISLKSKILDIGSYQGELFAFLENKEVFGVGIDPEFEQSTAYMKQGVKLIKASFPTSQVTDRDFDAICALAILEHIPQDHQPEFAKACYVLLKTKGKMIITVPSPLVDYIIHFLKLIKVVDGMSEEQHYGLLPKETIPVFEKAGFRLVVKRKFEFGLNNVFVFEK